MKQTVDFEQAKKLWEAGIQIFAEEGIDENGTLHFEPDYSSHLELYYNPTIGELIEWLEDQGKFIDINWNETGLWQCGNREEQIEAAELLDALVELILKIKGNNHG